LAKISNYAGVFLTQTRALLYPHGSRRRLATHACHKSPYLRPAPAATKPAILITTSFATGHAQRYRRTDTLLRLMYKDNSDK